jgi:hypothetical protein
MADGHGDMVLVADSTPTLSIAVYEAPGAFAFKMVEVRGGEVGCDTRAVVVMSGARGRLLLT